MKRLYFATLSLVALIFTCYAQDLEPGVSRWSIKTSLPASPAKKKADLETLLQLQDPVHHKNEAPKDARITKSIHGFKEGNLVTTKGYLILVALERDNKTKRDGDYHVQLRTTSDQGDSCFIVEVPFPDFIQDPDLKTQCEIVRNFIQRKLLKGKEPGTGGNIMQHPVYVKITGQLFFDAEHLIATGSTASRGKKGMKSYTCWEIHPVTSIAFTSIPNN